MSLIDAANTGQNIPESRGEFDYVEALAQLGTTSFFATKTRESMQDADDMAAKIDAIVSDARFTGHNVRVEFVDIEEIKPSAYLIQLTLMPR